LRERKDALGSAVNKVYRVEGRSWFQSKGPMIAKAHTQKNMHVYASEEEEQSFKLV